MFAWASLDFANSGYTTVVLTTIFNVYFVTVIAGDVTEAWADPAYAEDLLNWKARRTLEEMLTDAWCWQSGNPNGYGD